VTTLVGALLFPRFAPALLTAEPAAPGPSGS